MAITFNGPDLLIELDGASVQSIRDLYSRWVDWTNTGENQKWLPAFRTIADPPTVPVYAFLTNGWRVLPLENGTPYVLTMNDGFLSVDGGGDPFEPVTGVEPRIRYENPVIAVGYAAGSGLDADQQAQLRDLWQLQGLDPSAPMTVTRTTRTAGGVQQTIGGDGHNVSTVTRQ